MLQIQASIKKRSISVSEYGSEVTDWVDSYKIYGYIDTITISKSVVAQKFVQDSTNIFVTYDIVDIAQGDRLYVNGLGYEVNFVENPMMLNSHLEIELKPILEQQSQLESYIYYGFKADATISETDILAFSNQLIKTKAFSTDLDVTATYLYIAYPKSFGRSSIRLNNQLITSWTIQEIMVNGVNCYVYSIEETDATVHIDLF